MHEPVLDFSAGSCQILACTKAKVGAQYKLGRREQREKASEVVTAERETPGAAVRAAEPGKGVDGVWGAADDAEREKGGKVGIRELCNPFSVKTSDSEFEAESVLLFR